MNTVTLHYTNSSVTRITAEINFAGSSPHLQTTSITTFNDAIKSHPVSCHFHDCLFDQNSNNFLDVQNSHEPHKLFDKGLIPLL